MTSQEAQEARADLWMHLRERYPVSVPPESYDMGPLWYALVLIWRRLRLIERQVSRLVGDDK